MNFLLYFIPSWFLYHSLEYLLHSLGHSYKYGSYIYKIHKNHHTIHYPSNKLLSNEYRTTSLWGLPEGVIAYGPPMLLFFFFLSFTVKFGTFLIITSELLFISYLSDYLHSQIHLNGSWLEKYKWFLIKRELHFNHHKKLNTNYSLGGITYVFDKIFRTHNRIE